MKRRIAKHIILALYTVACKIESLFVHKLPKVEKIDYCLYEGSNHQKYISKKGTWEPVYQVGILIVINGEAYKWPLGIYLNTYDYKTVKKEIEHPYCIFMYYHPEKMAFVKQVMMRAKNRLTEIIAHIHPCVLSIAAIDAVLKTEKQLQSAILADEKYQFNARQMVAHLPYFLKKEKKQSIAVENLLLEQ